MRLKLDRKKRARLERGALDEDSKNDDSSSTERASNSSPKRDRKLSGRARVPQKTNGPLDIISHCADNSYRQKAMTGSTEEADDEVEGDSSHTSLCNNSDEDYETTDTEDLNITEV
jgi:hypothetical protein